MEPTDKPSDAENPTPATPVEGAPPVVVPAPDYSQAPSLQTPASPSGSNTLGGMIPTGNSASLVAYYCAIGGLVPCFAPILAPIAIVYGRRGLAAHRENPAIAGKTHSMLGVVLGSLELLLVLAIVIVIIVGIVSARRA